MSRLCRHECLHQRRCVDLVGKVEQISENSPHVSDLWVMVQLSLVCRKHSKNLLNVCWSSRPYCSVDDLLSLDDLIPRCLIFLSSPFFWTSFFFFFFWVIIPWTTLLLGVILPPLDHVFG